MNLPFFIAKRLISSKKGSFSAVFIRVAIFATALSMAAMLLAGAFVKGFQENLKSKLFGYMGHVHVTPYNADASNLITSQSMAGSTALQDTIAQLPNVVQVAPFIIRPAIIRFGTAMHGIKLKGIDKHYKLDAAISYAGHPINFADTAYAHDIVLSEKTASLLGINKGQALFLYFIEEGSIFPRIRKLNVCALYQTGMEEIDKSLALCDLRLLRRINNWPSESISGYQVELKDPMQMHATRDYINQHLLNENLIAASVTDVFPNLFNWLAMLNNNVLLLFIVMGAVAIVNIISALLLFSIERIAMSGLLRALGLSEKRLQLIHLYHALFIASIGILLGNIIALAIAWLQEKTHFITLDRDVYGMDYAAVYFDYTNMIALNVITLLVCFLSLWIPSYFMRRINIVKAITFK